MELGSALRAYVWDSTDGGFMPLCGEKEMRNNQVSFYLSPDGNDSGSGTLAEPFRTLARAKQAVRAQNSDMETDLNVYLTGGTYILDDTLTLDENDGGKNGHYVNCKAFDIVTAVDADGKYQYYTFGISERNAFYIENAFELLDTPGEFYFDKTVGALYYMAGGDDMTPVKEVCKNNTVSNNYITRIGGYNHGAPGIQTYYTEGTDISHNHIADVPYSGICIGWGWNGTTDSVTSKNNRVANKRIENYAQQTFDAGGIYTLGQQSGSVISGNYISGQNNGYGAFYPDSGSADYTVENNVFADIDVSYFMYTGGSRRNLTVRNNYSTPAGCETYGQDCTVEAPAEFLPWAVPSAAREIMERAGLEAAYSGLAGKAPAAGGSLSVAEMYGNAIDEDNPKIDALLNPKLVKYYLDNRTNGAKSVLASGRGLASADAASELEDAIAAAESVSNGMPATGALSIAENHAYRERVIRARIALIDSVRAFEADILQ